MGTGANLFCKMPKIFLKRSGLRMALGVGRDLNLKLVLKCLAYEGHQVDGMGERPTLTVARGQIATQGNNAGDTLRPVLREQGMHFVPGCPNAGHMGRDLPK
jgi:hypothetical protein